MVNTRDKYAISDAEEEHCPVCVCMYLSLCTENKNKLFLAQP